MWTLIVRSHGRWPYLERALDSLDLDFFDRRIFAFDGCIAGTKLIPRDERNEFLITGDERQGLTANLAQAWGALTTEDEWVLDWEEDFVALDLPLQEMADTLDAHRDVAQMALVRQPWSPEEHEAGGLLHGPHLQGDLADRGGWLHQKRIFTLNPYVAHASTLRSLHPGVETSLTSQCLERGLSFGYWGSMTDPPRVLHIGEHGGMNSPGWLP